PVSLQRRLPIPFDDPVKPSPVLLMLTSAIVPDVLDQRIAAEVRAELCLARTDQLRLRIDSPDHLGGVVGRRVSRALQVTSHDREKAGDDRGYQRAPPLAFHERWPSSSHSHYPARPSVWAVFIGGLLTIRTWH